MVMKHLIIFLAIVLASPTPDLQAQPTGKINIGIGAGLDYGGFGARISYLPIKQVAVFGAMGYNLDALGHTVGAQYRFPTEKRLDWFISAMYGYNAVLIIEEPVKTKTTYYGPSLGTGMEWKIKDGRSFVSVEILIPFRPQVYDDAINDLELIGYTVSEPLPVAFSVGYHIKIK